MDAITGAFGEAVQEFVRSGADLEAQVQRLGVALAVQRDMDAGADVLGLDGGLGAVLSLIEEMAGPSEELGAAYTRIVGATLLLDGALAMSGVELGKTREEVIRFAASIADAAGGLQQANDLWSAYFEGFYTEAERAQMALEQANAARDTALSSVGLDSDTTREEFRQAFEDALPTLTPEQVANWLRAGAAIVRADQAIEGLGGSLEEVADDARLAGDALEQAFSDARGIVTELFGSPLDQINAQIASLEGQRDAWQEASDAAVRFWDQQMESLKALRQQADDLLLGEFSPLRGEAKVEEALRQFNAALASGDFGRAQSLSGTVLSAGRDARASGRDFNELFEYVQSRLRTQGTVGSPPTVPPFDFEALNRLYTERDRLLLEQENAYRENLAAELAEFIADIAFSTGRPLEDIAEELGFSLPQLAAILGLTLDELRSYIGSMLPEDAALVDSQTFTGGRPPTLPVEAPAPVYAGSSTVTGGVAPDPSSQSLLREIRDELRRPSGGNRQLTRA
jgi:hypothetical protein